MSTRWRVACCALAMFACGDGDDVTASDPNEAFSGGASATVFDQTRDAYAQVLPAVKGDREDDFFVGNSIFNRAWATAPASVKQFDGLGPLFNATNCSACHFKDGRGRPPQDDGEPFTALLLRLSVPGTDPHGGPLEAPRYGNQLQDNGILGVPAEARPHVRYAEVPGTFADGEPYALRTPTYVLDELAYGPLPPNLQISPRVAPAVFGLGLLAALSDQTLEKLADPDDRDGDGISGRVNHVWDARRGAVAIGRFGWKANQPTIEQQTAGAFQGDMGIGNSMFGGQPCTDVETACLTAPSGVSTGESAELTDALLASVVSYMHTLAVPARRKLDDPQVRRGKKVFEQASCAKCHVPQLQTSELPGLPEVSNQVIRPYTDLLLHDMGPGLADGRPDFEASGTEWRTPPLWGLGLLQTVNSHSFLLHDGRARGPLEAVLAHGGEADQARESVRTLSRADREALVAFLNSL